MCRRDIDDGLESMLFSKESIQKNPSDINMAYISCRFPTIGYMRPYLRATNRYYRML